MTNLQSFVANVQEKIILLPHLDLTYNLPHDRVSGTTEYVIRNWVEYSTVPLVTEYSTEQCSTIASWVKLNKVPVFEGNQATGSTV